MIVLVMVVMVGHVTGLSIALPFQRELSKMIIIPIGIVREYSETCPKTPRSEAARKHAVASWMAGTHGSFTG